MASAPNAIGRFGRPRNGFEKARNPSTAHPSRTPKKTVNASGLRYPAEISRWRSLPSSDADRGADCPMRLNVSARRGANGEAGMGATSLPVSSPSRRAIVVVAPCDMYIAAATTSSETNRNPIRGSSTITLHLDLDDLANPEEADRLHHDRAKDHRAPHLRFDQRLDVLGADDRQHQGQRGREGQQDECRE